MIVLTFAVCMLQGCNNDPDYAARHKTQVVTNSPQAETQEPSKPSPKQATTAPADNSQQEEQQPEPPYYGSTYWNEVLTSVYFYPKGSSDHEGAVTHLKFDHREDDLWLCGDQRKSFKPGRRIQLSVTFEANQPCVTNWNFE
jgi:hypothetical protein